MVEVYKHIQSSINTGIHSCDIFTGVNIRIDGRNNYIRYPWVVEQNKGEIKIISSFGETVLVDGLNLSVKKLDEYSKSIQSDTEVKNLDYRHIIPTITRTESNSPDSVIVHLGFDTKDVDISGVQLWLCRLPINRKANRKGLAHTTHMNGVNIPIDGKIVDKVDFPKWRKEQFGGELCFYDGENNNKTYRNPFETEWDLTGRENGISILLKRNDFMKNGKFLGLYNTQKANYSFVIVKTDDKGYKHGNRVDFVLRNEGDNILIFTANMK